MQSGHAEFRIRLPVGELTVTGVLPATSPRRDREQPPMGSVSIAGDVQHLSCDEALELADALLLAVMRVDDVEEERHKTDDRNGED
jgi:hypothetical protein